MTSIATELSANASVLFGIVVEVAIKGTLLIAIVTAGAFVLRRASASLRHSLWSFGLLAMLFMPVLSAVVPRWQIGLLPQGALRGSDTRDRLPDARSPLPVPVGREPLADARQPLPVTSGPQPVASSSIVVPRPTLTLLDSLALL